MTWNMTIKSCCILARFILHGIFTMTIKKYILQILCNGVMLYCDENMKRSRLNLKLGIKSAVSTTLVQVVPLLLAGAYATSAG